MYTKILLALFAIIFVPTANAFAICPIVGIFAPPARTRVTVIHRYAPAVVTYRTAPVVQVVEAPAPDVEVIAPQPTVVYRQRTVYRSAVVAAPAVTVEAGQTGAQRRHANKAAREVRRSAEHAAKAAYWASRS